MLSFPAPSVRGVCVRDILVKENTVEALYTVELRGQPPLTYTLHEEGATVEALCMVELRRSKSAGVVRRC